MRIFQITGSESLNSRIQIFGMTGSESMGWAFSTIWDNRIQHYDVTGSDFGITGSDTVEKPDPTLWNNRIRLHGIIENESLK